METEDNREVATVSILHINVQSLSNKLLELEQIANDHEISVICINEHWLTDNEIRSVIINNYKLVSQYCRLDREHGGVCIFASHDFECTPINYDNLCKKKNFEVTGLDCGHCRVFTVYRSPSGDFEQFIDLLSVFLDKEYNQNVIISGDFNVKFDTSDADTIVL